MKEQFEEILSNDEETLKKVEELDKLLEISNRLDAQKEFLFRDVKEHPSEIVSINDFELIGLFSD